MIVNKKSISMQTLYIPAEFRSDIPTLFFDIETTGLYWKHSHLYEIGVAALEGDAFLLTQYLAEKPSEEEMLLQEFAAVSASYERLVHYNGDSFDLPYLAHKYAFYEMENCLKRLESIDLYRRIRPLKNLINISQLKQKDVEIFLNFYREDPFSGGELIKIYQDYLLTADEHLLQCLLLHNAEDLEGMLHILPILEYLRVFAGEVTLAGAHLDADRNLHLSFTYPGYTIPQPLETSYESYHLRLGEKGGELTVHAQTGVRKLFYPNCRDYFYLPLEDCAIHKSVGIYVDKEYRQQAKASNCYQKVEGVFLPQPSEILSPVLKKDHRDKTYWTPATEELLKDTEKLKEYMLAVLKGAGALNS